jgi:hypothetical protein
MDAVREANLRQCRAMIPNARIAILVKEAVPEQLKTRFAQEADAEAEVVRAARTGGWIDFDRLAEPGMLQWWERAALWPSGWGYSLALEDLGVSPDRRDAVRDADRRRNERAPVQRALLGQPWCACGRAREQGPQPWADRRDYRSCQG